MPSSLYHFDCFVSYARQDNKTGWVTRFVQELLAEHRSFAAGGELKPFFDQHAITTGADWQLFLAHGVTDSLLFPAFAIEIALQLVAPSATLRDWRSATS